MLAISEKVTKAFLFNKFLAFFDFLVAKICNAKAIAGLKTNVP